MKNCKLLFCALILLLLSQTDGMLLAQQLKNLLPYVNPFVGAADHGHTFPGACYPFGMMQLSPDTRLTGWDGCSGYHYSDNIIYGFSHTHLSGTGCSDYGDILLMPSPGPDITSSHGSFILQPYSWSAEFSHSNERASPGYYSVKFDNGIIAQLTVGQRAGMHRYIFPKDDSITVVLDLKHRDEVIDSRLTVISDTEIAGYRRSKAWAQDQRVYFDIRFSKPAREKLLFRNDTNIPFTQSFRSKNIKALFRFSHSGDTLLVKIGISAVSAINAAANLKSEISGWNFSGVRRQTEQAWNEYLNRIDVGAPAAAPRRGWRADSFPDNDDKAATFYTALYHTAIHPSLYSDVNGEYLGMDKETHKTRDFSIYTVFSIWDTYRALHPLYTIIAPEMDKQFIYTFLKQYEQGGMLPVWELAANETNCMIGYHTASIIADAFQKRIYGYDVEEALRALFHSATENTPSKNAFRKTGYVPADISGESVSKTLEYSYDDWCIAMVAKELGNMSEYMHYVTLAQNYKNVFDPSTGFMRARVNGAFYTPFDPREVNNNYTEANAWQYSFYVPQDVNGLIDLCGGKEKLAAKIDSLFTITSQTTGRKQDDISGMIGQYAQGNEPSHHIAYLFNYLDEPWKTTDYVHKIEKLYTPAPNGLCGNEDCGQMSAWYVMSAMGLYQVCPGDGQLILTTPLFDTVTLHLENGKTFSVISQKENPGATYITSATLNGRYYPKSFLNYDSLIKGGVLHYELSLSHKTNWGAGINAPCDSIEKDLQIIPQPYTGNSACTFRDSIKVELHAYSPADKIYYTLNDSTPDNRSNLYTHPFYADRSVCIKSVACRGSSCSMVNTTCYTKIPSGVMLDIKSTPDPQYTGGGPDALIDRRKGSPDFRLGKWQGYQGQDFEAVLDLGKEKEIKNVGAEFLQDAGSWILMPRYVDFALSKDGRKFNPAGHIADTLSDTTMKPTVIIFEKELMPQKARYIKVFAKNYGKLPEWNPGAGNDAYIFIDRLLVR